MQPDTLGARIFESRDMNVITHWFAPSDSPRTSLRGSGVARIGVGHALIDNCSSEQVCASIIAHAQNRGKPAYVITSNAQHIVQLEKERSLQEVYDHADLVIPDGISLADRRAALWTFAPAARRRRRYLQGAVRARREE